MENSATPNSSFKEDDQSIVCQVCRVSIKTNYSKKHFRSIGHAVTSEMQRLLQERSVPVTEKFQCVYHLERDGYPTADYLLRHVKSYHRDMFDQIRNAADIHEEEVVEGNHLLSEECSSFGNY